MNRNKIFKFVSLIIVILFFSYLNSQKVVSEEAEAKAENKTEKQSKEGFTGNIREYYNSNKRVVREKIEDFKSRGSNKIYSYVNKIRPSQ